MIQDVDEALRALLRAGVSGGAQVQVVFDAPTRDWAAKVNAPTVNLYLYDIREDLRRRERGLHNEYDERGVVVARRRPPRYFKLSYLITAWTKRPEDEHRLLSDLLLCLLAHDALPTDQLPESLAGPGLPIPVALALPPPEDRSFADVWSALGGELKPSLDLVVSVPFTEPSTLDAGPPVGPDGMRFGVGRTPPAPPPPRGTQPVYGAPRRRVRDRAAPPGAPTDTTPTPLTQPPIQPATPRGARVAERQ
jgi:Pvc16 N-terminal domain